MDRNSKGKAPVVDDVAGRRLIFGSLSGFECNVIDVNSFQYANNQSKRVVDVGERFRSPSENEAVVRRLLFGSVSGFDDGKGNETRGLSVSSERNHPTLSPCVAVPNDDVVDGGERVEILSGMLASGLDARNEVVDGVVGSLDQPCCDGDDENGIQICSPCCCS
ncbi:hypothetical protein L6452_42045 [Arctium lappa]|uniref:Uncharacterized protein n=1 Tax=Arctium lappa TaxID=4217 RepID=A0ACB8XGP4_ARCLA|nr:hypothetical protein L6452_42045 [Arctium lappa]